jgi:hypothetical protein
MNAPDRIAALRQRIDKQPAARREQYKAQLRAVLDLPADQQGERLKRLSLRVMRAEQLDARLPMTRDLGSAFTLH